MKENIEKSLPYVIIVLIILVSNIALAENVVITAIGEYVMGDNDTYTESRKLALQDAKRVMLEKIGTSMENNAYVKNGMVPIDKIKQYSIGIVRVEIIGEGRTISENNAVVVKVIVKAFMDPDAFIKEIISIHDRKNTEESAHKISYENEILKNEMEQLNQQLRIVTDEDKYIQLRARREVIFKKIDANEKELTSILGGNSLYEAALADRQKQANQLPEVQDKNHPAESSGEEMDNSLLGITMEVKKHNILLAAIFNVAPDFVAAHVKKGSAAELAGLKSGDIINEINEKYLYTLEQYNKEMSLGIQNKKIILSIRRGFKLLTIVIKL